MIKRCLICKKEYKAWGKESKFCSCKCYNQYQRLNPNKGTFRTGAHYSPETEFKKGQKHTDQWKEMMSKRNKGKRNYFWKGGRIKQRGYVFIYSPNHPYRDNKNYVTEHRLVTEKYLGRYLEPKERIHHINGIKDDNHLENLYYFPSENEHQRYHSSKNKSELKSNLKDIT